MQTVAAIAKLILKGCSGLQLPVGIAPNVGRYGARVSLLITDRPLFAGSIVNGTVGTVMPGWEEIGRLSGTLHREADIPQRLFASAKPSV